MHTISIKDETATGKIIEEISLEYEEESITVQELIKARVYAEVQKNKKPVFSPEPSGLGQFQEKNKFEEQQKYFDSLSDAEKQFYIALDAFQKNNFFIVFNNEQLDSLDQKIELKENTPVSFIKLTQLVGG